MGNTECPLRRPRQGRSLRCPVSATQDVSCHCCAKGCGFHQPCRVRSDDSLTPLLNARHLLGLAFPMIPELAPAALMWPWTSTAPPPGGRRYSCKQIGSYEQAQQLLRQGQTYLGAS